MRGPPGLMGLGLTAPPVTLSMWLWPAVPEGTVTSGGRVPVIPMGSGRAPGGWVGGEGDWGSLGPRRGDPGDFGGGEGHHQAPAAPSLSWPCYEWLRDCISGRHFGGTASPWPGGGGAPSTGETEAREWGGSAPWQETGPIWAPPTWRNWVEGVLFPAPTALCFG